MCYNLGETTYPTFGKIFVFETLEQADAWRANYSEVILKGFGKNPVKIKFVSSEHFDAEIFWKLKLSKKNWKTKVSFWDNAREGTMVVDSFTPTEKVEA